MYQPGYRSPFYNYYTYLNGGDHEVQKSWNKLKVYGEGIVRIKPDIAEVSIGILTDNMLLEVAQKENATITQQVINSIQNNGIPSKDIQTQAYNIEPQYDYIEGKQVFRGYRVTNILRIVVRDLEQVGALIDSAVKAGANIVNNILFKVSDSSKFYEQALKLAIEDAQRKALIVADKLKVRVNPIPVQIIEQGKSNAIPLSPMMLKVSEVATPIESGEIEVRAVIEAKFIYSE